MLRDLITLHCVRYDPVRCGLDPETIWHRVQAMGGTVQSLNYGIMDFYVPDRYITAIMLLDSGLRIVESKSYI